MAWRGWYQFGGVEVINTDRTEAYAQHANLSWFKPVYNNGNLAALLGDPEYATPLQDDAPWADPDEPASYGFFGAYPLDITGVEDSTWTANVIESTGDGGVVGRPRRASRTVVFSLALIAVDECSADYGFKWLKNAFLGGPCIGTQQDCNVGNTMCFLTCPPVLDWSVNGDLDDCWDKWLQSLHNVTITSGPLVDGKRELTDGGAVWLVTVTVVAGNPVLFSDERPLIKGFGDPDVDIPYVGGVVPPGGSFDFDGYIQTEVACPVPIYNPVFDPLCPQVIPPPAVPAIALSCFDFPVNFLRRQFAIPAQNVPLWSKVVPYFEIHAVTKEVRSLRLRFYSDPDGDGSTLDDPCAFCGDIVFSYIPQGETMIFDGADHLVYVTSPTNGRRRADSLVFGSDGKPFEWPELTCGYGYIVALDMPQTQVPPIVDMSLFARAV